MPRDADFLAAVETKKRELMEQYGIRLEVEINAEIDQMDEEDCPAMDDDALARLGVSNVPPSQPTPREIMRDVQPTPREIMRDVQPTHRNNGVLHGWMDDNSTPRPLTDEEQAILTRNRTPFGSANSHLYASIVDSPFFSEEGYQFGVCISNNPRYQEDRHINFFGIEEFDELMENTYGTTYATREMLENKLYIDLGFQQSNSFDAMITQSFRDEMED